MCVPFCVLLYGCKSWAFYTKNIQKIPEDQHVQCVQGIPGPWVVKMILSAMQRRKHLNKPRHSYEQLWTETAEHIVP
jgi:hypothetical protein